MPFQILDDPNKGAVSQSIGNAISSGLQSLVSHKMNAIQRDNTSKGLRALGYDAKQAHELSFLDPQSLQQVVKQKLQEPSEKAYAQALGSLLGNEQQQSGLQQPQQQIAQPEPNRLPSIANLSPKQRNQLKEYLASPKAPKVYSPELINRLNESLQEPQAQVANALEQPQQNIASSAGVPLGGLNAKQATEIAKLGFEKKRLDVQERKLQHQMQKDALVETKELRKEILDKKKVAKESLENIDRLEELEKEGLPGPGYIEALKNAGLDIPALVGAPAEEYNKIAAGFLRGAKAMFGSRLTDNDLQQFLKLLPSLSNSPEGRKRINSNLKRFYNLDIAAGQAYDEIIKANKGIPPLDLDIQIDRKIDKKRDAIAKQFKSDLQKKVPKGESALTTAILASGGKLVGNIPKAAEGALKGAALGSYIGSRGGPIGLAGGAVIGGISGLLGYAPSLKDII